MGNNERKPIRYTPPTCEELAEDGDCLSLRAIARTAQKVGKVIESITGNRALPDEDQLSAVIIEIENGERMIITWDDPDMGRAYIELDVLPAVPHWYLGVYAPSASLVTLRINDYPPGYYEGAPSIGESLPRTTLVCMRNVSQAYYSLPDRPQLWVGEEGTSTFEITDDERALLNNRGIQFSDSDLITSLMDPILSRMKPLFQDPRTGEYSFEHPFSQQL